MVDIDPDPDEAARRLRAAIAYVGLPQADAAKALGVSIPTLARMTARKGADGVRPATWSELWRAADKLGLPRAWFVADLAQLHQLVPDDMPGFRSEAGREFPALRPTGAARSSAQLREEQALRREAQRSRARQQAERDTKPVPNRRRSGSD